MSENGALKINFNILGTQTTLTVNNPTVVIAGYTGRDEESVLEHIEELAAIGVEPPESIPTFFPMEQGILTQDSEILVDGDFTSGEVEPVLIFCNNNFYLSVGSDHTDRDIEREDILRSKAACPKPLSTDAVFLGDVSSFEWDVVEAESVVDGVRYQQGTMGNLRIPTDVLAIFREKYSASNENVVMFCGTWPIIGGKFVAGSKWEISLQIPGGSRLSHQYRTIVSKLSS